MEGPLKTAGDRSTAAPPLDDALRALTAGSVPGLSLVVAERDRFVTERAAGLADIEAQHPAGLDTAYLWFSMTKIVTATAAMQLTERGSLGLDDPVREHLPEFPAPQAGWPQVTVRHLLSHSAGLANPLPVRWVHPADQPPRDPHEFTLDLLARHRRLRFPAGTKASYSNLGYLALGEVITAAAGQRYEDHVREHILRPLGMDRTDFGYRPDMAADSATGYQSRRSPMTPLFRLLLPKGIAAGAVGPYLAFQRFCVDGPAYGGLVGSVRDAARFMTVHLNGGSAGREQLLSGRSVAAMQAIQARGRKLDVGLGWFRRRADPAGAVPHLEHLGGGGGFFNMMRIYPRRSAGLVLMGNATSYDQQGVAAAALDAIGDALNRRAGRAPGRSGRIVGPRPARSCTDFGKRTRAAGSSRTTGASGSSAPGI
jgi:CubicO group peptidase (beta-lactamase class C family)